jgi:hypothetical protein
MAYTGMEILKERPMTGKTPPAKPAAPKPIAATPKTPTVKKHGGPPPTKADHAAFRRTDKTVIKRMRKQH